MQVESSETDLVLQLEITVRDGKRSGKTEQTPSNLLQRPQAVTLIASKIALIDILKLQYKIKICARIKHVTWTVSSIMLEMCICTIAQSIPHQVSSNAQPNANASIQPSRLTGEA